MQGEKQRGRMLGVAASVPQAKPHRACFCASEREPGTAFQMVAGDRVYHEDR